jgi:hypothetical protein
MAAKKKHGECNGTEGETCYEDKDDCLWMHPGEYESQVNYCPFCGYKAKKQIKPNKKKE